MALHPAWLDGLAGLDRDPALSPLLFQHPALRLAVAIDERRPHLVAPPPPGWHLPAPMFAKLGAKSWRDGGSLRIVGDHLAFMPQVTALLANLSDVQQCYLDRVRPHVARLDLSVFPYRDFTQISEVRWRVTAGRASATSRCLRGASALKLRGLKGAAEEFTMAAAAYNLQLLANRAAPA